jgi:hypothetical protein
MPGSLIWKIVPGHTCNHNMVQTKLHGSVGEALRLRNIRRKGHGISLGHCAKSAATGAGIPKNHEGGRVMAPAITYIRTLGLFADSNKFLLA